MKKIVLIGIGQAYRGDDAIGTHLVQCWQQEHGKAHAQVRVEICPLPGLGLLDLFDSSETVIIVDAVHSGAQPGTLHLIDMAALQAFQPGSASAHGFGVAETLQLAQKIDPDLLPSQLIILGIEAQQMELGQSFSAPVQLAIPQAVTRLNEIVQQLSS